MDTSPRPPEEKTSVASLILSVLVHAALVGALFFGVQWKNQTPSSVAVEVWRGAPRVVTAKPEPAPEPKIEPPPEPRVEPAPEPPPPPPPPPPEPKIEPRVEPPPPVDPDIVLKEEQRKQEELRLEEERRRQEELRKEEERRKQEELRKEEERRKQEELRKEEEQRKQEELRKEEERRKEEMRKQAERDLKDARRRKEMQDMMAGADAELGRMRADQAAAARARGLADYTARIRAKIKGNIVLPPSVDGNPEAIFKVRQLPSGEIIDVRLGKSSGNKLLDEAIERAIRKSNPLPLPGQPSLFNRDLEIKYKPFDE